MSKQFEIEDIQVTIKTESFANLFNVYDEQKLGDNFKTYSINRTVNFKGIAAASPSLVDKYLISLSDSWTSIAFKFYGSEDLWWLICKTNGIVDPATELVEGSEINILKKQYVAKILSQVKEK
jgi:hypothetical protein